MNRNCSGSPCDEIVNPTKQSGTSRPALPVSTRKQSNKERLGKCSPTNQHPIQLCVLQKLHDKARYGMSLRGMRPIKYSKIARMESVEGEGIGSR
mmetsp:Transcript_42198/g.132929  ORF Transcript_42198/g.132929 Transcript_42198/m.132929 type:complete len:95 (+) Transcript_42198:1009-1293(+)